MVQGASKEGERNERLGSGAALSVVALGVLAVSTSAILIRLADAPALAVAFWRNALGVLVLLPFVFYRRDAFPKGWALWVGIASGAALRAHFGTWISSLDYTSVAASVVLVSLGPVFVAVFAYLAFGERTSPLSLFGILVALAGTAVISSGESSGSAALFGDALAVAGAVTFAVYVLLGRSLRASGIGVLPYSVVVYASAAATLLPVALYSNAPLWGYSEETWLWLVAITVGPQILGHTVFNWALRHVEASVVSGTVLAEPVVSAALAWWILSEKPGLPTVLGGLIVLLGLLFLLRGRRRAPPAEPTG